MRRETCLFYMQGRCRFGDKCRFSHDGFHEGLMIRHAQSEFNFASQSISSQAFLEEKAKQEFQLNLNFIDCQLSVEGQKQARQIRLPKEYIESKRGIDIIFVSPLERTLKTAQIIIQSHKLKVGVVLVLPEITEVLSKVCDFSSSLTSKKQKYPHFDFDEMIRFLKYNKIEKQSQWQDALVDQQYRNQINRKEEFGHRYMKILENIFPTPLESSDSCFDRSLKALEIMKTIAEHLKAKKILVVSHNRVLKYLDGRFNKGRGRSFGNCQIRSLIF